MIYLIHNRKSKENKRRSGLSPPVIDPLPSSSEDFRQGSGKQKSNQKKVRQQKTSD